MTVLKDRLKTLILILVKILFYLIAYIGFFYYQPI